MLDIEIANVKSPVRRAISALIAAAAFAAAMNSTVAQSAFEREIWVGLGDLVAANGPTFASRKDAEHFLAQFLPLATRANPKYTTKADGVETVWLTKSIRFEDLPAGAGVQITMDEEFTQFRAGVATVGAHQAAFSLADVEISMFAAATDVTPNGDAAMGILFTCAAPGCIVSRWNGQPSKADKSDIYIQDLGQRQKIAAALAYLRNANRGGKAPI